MILPNLVSQPASQRNAVYGPVLNVYALEALSSIAAVFLLAGIYFYTHQHFGWGVRQNLLLATGTGLVYIPGALLANPLSAKLGRRKAFLLLQIALLAIALLALAMQRPIPLTILLLLYSGISAGQWPVLESLVSSGSGDVLSKRLSGYNLCWSATNAATLAVTGTVLHYYQGGIFVAAAICQFFSAIITSANRSEPPPAAPAHLDPQPGILAVRKQALWLSRIALPSTYIVVGSLNAMMPSLPVMHSINTQWATLLSSVWFCARCAAFAGLGATSFWHTRPRLMLAAAGLMLVAFLGVTLRPSDLLHITPALDLPSMIISQIFLGAAMGTIYSASLYFGMVLSEGSTEHGGYHEALIGLGFVFGPASAYLADTLRPGQLDFGIAAVAGLIGLSVVAAVAASFQTSRTL